MIHTITGEEIPIFPREPVYRYHSTEVEGPWVRSQRACAFLYERTDEKGKPNGILSIGLIGDEDGVYAYHGNQVLSVCNDPAIISPILDRAIDKIMDEMKKTSAVRIAIEFTMETRCTEDVRDVLKKMSCAEWLEYIRDADFSDILSIKEEEGGMIKFDKCRNRGEWVKDQPW